VTLRAMVGLLGVCAALPALAACETANADLATLKQLLAQSPELLAVRAAEEGRVQFLAVAGYTILLPGVGAPSCALDKRQFQIIRGTSDIICSIEQRKLQPAANAFAERYNRALQNDPRASRLLQCDS
jgi:hypothetical protein